MRATRPISLFTERTPARNRPSAFVASVFAHCGFVFLIVYGFLFAPRINIDNVAERYIVRQVDIEPIELPPPPRKVKAAGSSAHYPTPKPETPKPASHSRLAAPSSSVRRLHLKLADKTLVEPNAHVNLVVKQTTPALLLWQKAHPNVTLVRPPAFKQPMLNSVRASITPPTEATHVADMAISPTPFTSRLPMPIPSTTTPILVHAPTPADTVPETASMTTSTSSSMAVMSVSEYNMAKGAFALPPANQSARGTEDGTMAPGNKGKSALAGIGDAHSRGTGAKNGDGLGKADEVADARGAGANTGAGTGHGAGHGAGPGTSSGAGFSIDGPDVTATPLKLSPNGKYGVMAVGSAIQQEYPETAGMWGSRLVFSVYLHVGLSHNWILQFTMPTSAGPKGALTDVKQIQAPWPYFIMRPNVDADYVNSNALMIHGYINDKGRFEQLALVLPPRYGHVEQLLNALKQWQFRPAQQSGSPARVEVLLIMPEGGL